MEPSTCPRARRRRASSRARHKKSAGFAAPACATDGRRRAPWWRAVPSRASGPAPLAFPSCPDTPCMETQTAGGVAPGGPEHVPCPAARALLVRRIGRRPRALDRPGGRSPETYASGRKGTCSPAARGRPAGFARLGGPVTPCRHEPPMVTVRSAGQPICDRPCVALARHRWW